MGELNNIFAEVMRDNSQYLNNLYKVIFKDYVNVKLRTG